MASANAGVCEVVPHPDGRGFNYYLPPFGPMLTQDPPPPVMNTAPGSERGGVMFIPSSSDANIDQEMAWTQSLCNGRRVGQVLEFRGDQWKKAPIDFLESDAARTPLVQAILKEIDSHTDD
jgi:hypothetical protein